MKIDLNTRLVILSFLSLLSPLLGATQAAAEITQARIVGSWGLEKFTVESEDGSSTPYCAGAKGTLLYEATGYMSVSINCATAEDSLFYSGKFAILGNSIEHQISNANNLTLIGKTLTRKVETLTDVALELTGQSGSTGQKIRILWNRLPTSQALAPQAQLAVLTYLKLKPGTEEKFLTELSKIVQPSRSEPGNIAWYVQHSQTDPTEFVFYTRWVNEDALNWHLKSAPLAAYIQNTAPMLESGYPQLVRYAPNDVN